MDIVCRSPLSCSSLPWWRSRTRLTRTIVVKATFNLQPRQCELSDQQDPIASADQHDTGSGATAVRVPSDLVPFKACADVVLVGSAYPAGVAARSLVARLAVGALDKTLELRLDGPPITAVPTTGFAPVPAGAPARRALWTEPGEPSLARFAAEPVLERIAKSYFNIAPPDQQLQRIQPRERIVLEHLHPDIPRLITALPGIAPRAFVERTRQEIQLICDTLLIDTDRLTCTVSWRGQLDLSEQEPSPRVVVEVEQDGEPLEPPETMFNEQTHDHGAAPRPVAPAPVALSRAKAHTLPFRRLEGMAPGAEPPAIAREPAPGGAPTSTTTGLFKALEEPVTGPGWLRKPAPTAPASRPSWAASATPPQARPASPTPAPPLPPVPAVRTAAGLGQVPAGLPSVAVDPVAARSEPLAAAPARPAPVFAPVHATGGVNPLSVGGAPIPPAYVPALSKVAEPVAVNVPGHASVFGAEAASNAAVAASAAPAREDAPAVARPRATSAQPLELVWFDVKSGRRLRIWWKDVLADLAFADFDSKHEVPTEDPEADKLRHEVFGVLTREAAIDTAGLRHVIGDAIDEHGRFTPPLAVVEADLRMQYGELARLEVLAALVSPLAGTDKRLKELTEAAAEVLKAVKPGGAAQASRLNVQIREHHQLVHGKSPNAMQLDVEMERALLEARSYDERTLLGSRHLRAVVGSAHEALPAYVPETARDSLPLLETFRARVIAEVHARQDRTESHALALRVVAIARLISLEGVRRP